MNNLHFMQSAHFEVSVNDRRSLSMHVTHSLTGLVEHPQHLTRSERLS